MTNALVTGASSGIGLAISKMLIKNNIHVYGIGRSFDNVNFDSELFTPIICDLKKTSELTNMINTLKIPEYTMFIKLKLRMVKN